MAIILNDNIRVNAGKPVDFKYLSTGNTVYNTTAEVNSTIAVPERYTGLTVNILGEEYWFKEGVTDVDLVQKITPALGSGTITGATNIGFFSGTTAVQTLNITASSGLPVGDHTEYTGAYASLYNYFYRDEQGFIRIGESVGGYFLRAYVKTTSPVKSLIWNDKDDGIDSRGWYLIDGDANLLIGTEVSGIDYGTPYLNTTWLNQAYNNGSNITISSVVGNLTGGTSLTVGGPVYSRTIDNNTTLELRTIRSLTPQTLSVSYDDAFINLSSSVICAMTGATNGIYTCTTGNTNVVRLGGNLTEQTTISGVDYNWSLSVTGINTLTFEAFDFVIGNNADFKPARYSGNYFNNPSLITPRSIPDVEYVTGYTQSSSLVKPINNITVSSYAATIDDFYIGASGGSTITLPSSTVTPSGFIIVVADVVGDAASGNEVQVNAGAGTTFFGGSSFSLISTAFGSMTYIYNAEKLRWGVVAFNQAPI